MFYIIPPGVIGIIFFCISFYLSIDNTKTYPSYVNPISLITIAGTVPLGIFVGSFAVRQTALIARGLTTKQYESITRQIVINSHNENRNMLSHFSLNNNLTFLEKLHNIWRFIRKSTTPSLISDSDL